MLTIRKPGLVSGSTLPSFRRIALASTIPAPQHLLVAAASESRGLSLRASPMPAREPVRRLERAGIFLSKAGDAVSIDPRRMEEVHRIIQMEWTEPGLFDGLE